jgi:hypothetical protein
MLLLPCICALLCVACTDTGDLRCMGLQGWSLAVANVLCVLLRFIYGSGWPGP